MNNKGQFSIIAALLVAVVLIGSVMTTYSAIRYNPIQGQPQILSSLDESNQALKQILGFTVGYYGSVLRVTGNVTYAQQLANNYFDSGLTNAGSIKPEWGLSLGSADLELKANWFTNDSFSQGNMNVTYDLNGLGITGISYSDSTRLEVQVSDINSTTQAQFKVLTDNGDPLINLAAKNIKFYRYVYGNLTWDFSVPTNIISHGDGTYIVDLPQGVSGNSYVVQVEDTRGLSVLASAFSEFTTSIAWNTTGFKLIPDFVDIANFDVLGTHSNFVAQQSGPDGIFDTLTEAASGTAQVPSYPTNYNTYGSTTLAGGSTNSLQVSDGAYMSFHSYISSFSVSNSTFGFTGNGTNTQSIENDIRGSLFNIPDSGQVQTISAYLELSSASNRRVKTAIYSVSHNFIAESEEKTVSSSGWYNFSFANPKPILIAGSNYILVAWSDNTAGTVSLRYDSGSSNQGHSRSQGYGSWPSSLNFNHDNNKYSIYCTYIPANQFTAQIELTGISIADFPWTNLVWTIDGSVSTNSVSATFQLFNPVTGQYATSGEGFMNATLDSGDQTKIQTIVANPESFLNSSRYWKVNITAVKSTSMPFDLNLDFVQYNPAAPNYALNLEEQWTNVNATNLRQDLCIKTGTFTPNSETLLVQILQGGNWQNLTTLTQNYFNNVSLAPFINSPTVTIRFVGTSETADPTRDSWNIDSVYIKDEPDINFLVNQQQSTFTMELLQNGTMRWLGQNMQSTSQTLPIPPIPVRAIHVNQTINGVNQEVPFQIEDWGSSYQIPLGLTSNTTLFGNRQMIVFLLNSKVTAFTVWWNGTDTATQTPMAYTNRYFVNDNTGASTITNGNVTLLIGGFNVKATAGSTSSTANFMRINQQASTYGAGAAYVIHHGIVRDIVQQEAEWNNGPPGSPNLYANIVIALPANTTYYTYQLRIMFINSAQARSITDLSLIQLTTSLGSPQLQTENGTLAGSPLLQNGTGSFINSTSGSWTPIHFSQFISAGKGAGIMFNDVANQKLYAFNSFAGSTSEGGFKVGASSIEMNPVNSGSAQFTFPYDITWQGAVATFDGTTPLCNLYDATTPMGLWLLAEYPPALTVTPQS